MPTKRLALTNSRGQELSARLELPIHGRAASIAVVAHCFTCSKDLKGLRAIARSMTHVGIGVLRFDFTGLGESGGQFSETTLSSDVDDIVEVAHQVEEQYAPVELLVGHSLGGAAAVLAAEQMDDVRAVTTIGAPSEPVHVKEHFGDSVERILDEGEAIVDIGGREFAVQRKFIEDLQTTHLSDALRDLKRPLLVMHAPRDEIVGVDHARKIFQAARHPKSFISLDEADHLLSDLDHADYVGHLIASWARRYVTTQSVDDWRSDAGSGQNMARTEGGMRTEVVANGFPLIADEPTEHGGTDTGPKPHDYLSAGLASCMTMTLRLYADRKEWPLDAAVAHVDHRQLEDDDGDRLDRFACRIELEGDLDDDQRQRMLEIAGRCPVHRTLESNIEVTTELVDA